MPTPANMSANQKGGWGRVALAAFGTLALLTAALAYDAETALIVAGGVFIALLVRFVILVRREM